MALTFKCFFCGRLVSVFKEDKKYVDCPDCGGRIDVNPEMAVSSVLTGGKTSCSGCLVLLLILGGIIFAVMTYKDKPKRSPRVPQSQPRAESSAYSMNASQMKQHIEYIVESAVFQKRERNENFFAPHLSWQKEKTLPEELESRIAKKRRLHQDASAKLVRNLTYEIYEDLSQRTFSSKEDFSSALTAKYDSIQNKEQEEFAKAREQAIKDLAYLLVSHLPLFAENKEGWGEKTADEAFLQNLAPESYEKLFLPFARPMLYWEARNMLHYGFVETPVSEISSEKKQLLAWEKFAFPYEVEGKTVYYHWVILSNGKIEQWTKDQLYDALGLIK